MICNSKLTIYHKSFDEENRLETWTRYNYEKAWVFQSKSSAMNKGYDKINNVEVRLPYDLNKGLNINDFAIGDIIVPEELTIDITTQQDLEEYNIYNITGIKNNNFGNNPHIHLGGN